MPVLRNPRHEKFSQLVAAGIPAKEAYISVGYSENGAPQSAANLLKRTDVRARVEEILSAAAISTATQVAFDHERVLHRLDVLSRRAEELKQISAAVRAEELIGKARGLFVDRVEQTGAIKTVKDIPAEVLEEMVREGQMLAEEQKNQEPPLPMN